MKNKQPNSNLIQGDLTKYIKIGQTIKTILKQEYPDEEIRNLGGTKSNGIITIISVINFEKRIRDMIRLNHNKITNEIGYNLSGIHNPKVKEKIQTELDSF